MNLPIPLPSRPDSDEVNNVRFQSFPRHERVKMNDLIHNSNDHSEYQGVKFFDPKVGDRLREYKNRRPGPPLPPNVSREEYLAGIVRDRQLPTENERIALNQNQVFYWSLSSIAAPDFTPNIKYPELASISRKPCNEQPLLNWAYVRHVFPPLKKYYNPDNNDLLKTKRRWYDRYRPEITSPFDIRDVRSSDPVYWKITTETECHNNRPNRETTILVGGDGRPIAVAARVLKPGEKKQYRLADRINWDGPFYRGPKPSEMETAHMTSMELKHWFDDHLQADLDLQSKKP